MAEALKRPGGELASRPLHFFWVVDCSGSMYGEKIGTVNHAIQSIRKHCRQIPCSTLALQRTNRSVWHG